MPISLYDATVPSWLQILKALQGLVHKAQAYCDEQQKAPEFVLQARLAPDMFPFVYQIKSAVAHSIGALEGLRRGTYSPDQSPLPDSFAALNAALQDAVTQLEAVQPGELDAMAGRDMRFEVGQYRIDFVAEHFLFTFSQPNFYFHATTAYDILRHLGLPIGKMDFLGLMRTKS